MAQLPLSLVALHGIAHGLARDYTRPWRILIGQVVQNDLSGAYPSAVPDRGTHPGSGVQAAVAGEHDQTVRRVRPLLRREDRIDRPARVRIRRRNPCFL
jgi:hypothetical protein